MAKQDFYELLGVGKSADVDELKKAYRKLAMKFHPDRNAGDKTAEQKFKEISEAYDILKDPEKRAAYDRFGHAAFDGTAGGGGGRGGSGAGDFGFNFSGGFADIFDEMFGDFGGRDQRGGAGGGAGQGRGADLRYNMEISLEDAFAGKQATIRVPTAAGCETCSGSGAAKGSKPATCSACGGRGRVRAQQGFFTIERTCAACHGQGQVIDKPCPTCRGAGRVQKEKTLSVSIPAGVEDGTRIRLTGEGEAGLRGGPSGDLYIFLSIKPHQYFQRDGANIYMRVPLSMTKAALGGVIEVPHGRWRAGPRHRARRHPDRASVPPQGQGHERHARDRARRHVYPRPGRNPGQAEQASEGTSQGVRGRIPGLAHQPRIRRLFRQGQGSLG